MTMNFSIALEPKEDENPARTLHAILKRPQASWSQSVFSVPLGHKIVPNRDYPYEGLSVLIEGENFHFLDGIAVGAQKGEDYVQLSAKKVNVSPWKMSYLYKNDAERLQLTADYYLMNSGTAQNCATACIALESNASSVVIEPLVDIRHMYGHSMPAYHFCRTLSDGMLISRAGKFISIRTANDCEVRPGTKEIAWWYKLGSGFREKTAAGGVTFTGELKKPVSVGELEIPVDNTSTALLVVSCSNSEAELEGLNERGKDWLHDEAGEKKRAEEIVKSLDSSITDTAVAFRALALSKFGMYAGGDFFYEAGDFWFRTPWFRDLFEGIINNIETLIRIGDAEKIRDIILHSFEYQDEYGRIPNRFPERSSEKVDYNNADATFLAFIAAGEFLKRRWDEAFAATLLERAEYTIARFKMNDLKMINGAPVLNKTGLVSIVPWHSWADTRRKVEIEGKKVNVPVRIPDSWCEDLKDENELNRPTYFLPEINAQWMKMLRHCATIAKDENVKGHFLALLEKAIVNFRTVFWDAEESNLYNLVTMEGKKDKTRGSPAVVAFSLLWDEKVFSHPELEQFIAGVKANLLVERDGLPFGILVKKSPKRIYYGDEEYHEAVVWPRDTPYLIKLLRSAGEHEKRTVEGLLRSNVAHQMSEGFVFYNSELFSPDNGAPTPVKNPVQFWSQWVDPFLEV